MSTQTQTIKLPFTIQDQKDYVLVPFRLFQKFQKDKVKLEQSLKQQKELIETLQLIREGEEEYLSSKTTTQSLASLIK